MIIEKVDPSRESYSDYELDGTILTVGGITVDLEAEQEDSEKVIEFTKCKNSGMVVRGMMPCCEYLAELLIPPKQYEETEIDNSDLESDEDFEDEDYEDEDDEESIDELEVSETITERVALPLDLESVVLRLWPVEVLPETEPEEITENTEEEITENTENENEGVENAE